MGTWNRIVNIEEQKVPEQAAKPRNTGLAIVISVVATIVFYVLYKLMFTLFVSFYASYDPSFSSGLGALILIVFGSNVLAFVSGAAVSRQFFPRASSHGVFYSLSSLIVMLALVSIISELSRPNSSIVIILLHILITVGIVTGLYIFIDPRNYVTLDRDDRMM